ncbi:hypothetical protein PLESTB_000115800 [Pleodorina starrii]|uniref:Uncharacterized protein n=1 Tax=Pleodorina starrii TaxID=330485 RepID=A0A9W6BAM8_9CHLO|nr:hypothetical protein PLESTB_000115800 [Pleodorina starrii]GLC71923.1 hypothetical protein PLESTF_001181500 [Pleodorina starrii]
MAQDGEDDDGDDDDGDDDGEQRPLAVGAQGEDVAEREVVAEGGAPRRRRERRGIPCCCWQPRLRVKTRRYGREARIAARAAPDALLAVVAVEDEEVVGLLAAAAAAVLVAVVEAAEAAMAEVLLTIRGVAVGVAVPLRSAVARRFPTLGLAVSAGAAVVEAFASDLNQ